MTEQALNRIQRAFLDRELAGKKRGDADATKLWAEAAGRRAGREAARVRGAGGRGMTSALCEWRAELAAVLGDDATRAQLLRQTQQGYEEIGAPGHAERIELLIH